MERGVVWTSRRGCKFSASLVGGGFLGTLIFPGTKKPKKSPAPIAWSRAYTWRRPTLTRPIVSLPLALRRFTSGFGMGPGGSTALWSPEGDPDFQDRDSGDLSYVAVTDKWAFGFTQRPLPDIHTEISNFST